MYPGAPLHPWIEDSLSIHTPGTAFLGSDILFGPGVRTEGFFYENLGNTGWVTITETAGGVFRGIEFLLGEGRVAPEPISVVYEMLLGGVVVSAGQFFRERGTVIGFIETGGFDELRVGALASADYQNLGEFQGIAIDDLRAAMIPEPATSTLIFLGLLQLSQRSLRPSNRQNRSRS